MTDNDLITLPEAAELLRTSEATLRFWRYEGTGPRSAKLGRRVVYRRSEILQWIESQFEKETA